MPTCDGMAEVERLESAQKWPEALAAAKRAEAALAAGEADPATRQRVRELLKDLKFIDRLEQIRVQKLLAMGNFANAAADRDYAQAFREHARSRKRHL